MSKHDATLLDMCVRDSFSKKTSSFVVSSEYRRKLLASRKFVLSYDMSAYLADMTCAPFAPLQEGLRDITHPNEEQKALIKKRNDKAIAMLENARHLARAPHAVTWIEYDAIARRRRTKAEYSDFVGLSSASFIEDEDEICPRVGWLIEQHPSLPTAFKATEFFNIDKNGVVVMMPYSFVWTTDDDSVMPWKVINDERKHAAISKLATGINTYDTDRVGIIASDKFNLSEVSIGELLLESAGVLRAIWFFLATLNDIPITFDAVRPSKGYVARGSYHRFSEHTIINITIPAHRSLKTIASRALANLRRRAHHVRGHWRDDWRHPPSIHCAEHAWVSKDDLCIICDVCKGRRLWITEHERGDASLGFVLHDYTVGTGKKSA